MSRDLSDLLGSGPVLVNIHATSAKQALARLSEAMAEGMGRPCKPILHAIMERERLGSTAVGQGVVLPHARISDLTQTVGGFARLSEPVEFDAMDDQPCDLLFMLLAPDNSGADHLRALARVARVMRQENVREELRAARDGEAVRQILGGVVRSSAA